MLSFLLSKFGLGKLFAFSLISGVLIGSVPTAIFVNNIWNGKISKAKISNLEADLSAQRLARQLAERSEASYKELAESKDAIILTLRNQNSHLVDVNARFAEKQAARDTLTIQTGETMKNEAAKTDFCATTDMDNGMRLFANGE